MLYPQSNPARTCVDLSGVWSFRLEETAPWQPIAVPGSFNDQAPDPAFRSHVGLCWYQTRFAVPAALAGQRAVLRFDAVTHDARVFLDGTLLCAHRGGFLPFEAEITSLAAPGTEHTLLVEVDNRIHHHTLPIGNEGGTAFFGSDNPGIPSVEAGKRRQQARGVNLPNFDFFNYAGLTRPVRLCFTPQAYIADITVQARLDGTVDYRLDTCGSGEAAVEIRDAQGRVVASAQGAAGRMRIPDPIPWEPRPGVPYLYTLHARFGADAYALPFGVREVRVEGPRFLINGKPFYFHGPCKHEDSAFHGRGLDNCLNVTDVKLYRWLHANALRTSHYPYAEEMYALCDREGIVVIDEAPAVGMGAGSREDPYQWGNGDYHAQVLADLIARDKNHPCVVMWSLGNEPDTEHFPQSALAYWQALYALAHRLDPQSRPVTLVGCQNDYTKDVTLPAMDVVCINRYYGWYNLSGDLDTAAWAFRQELDYWQRVGKPLILSEYGADTLAGLHAAAPAMFTEEFQAAYYQAMNACLDQRDFIAGEMPWNFADFGTQQGPMRPGGNRKGLFTRDRQPKLAAHYFRKRWGDMEEKARDAAPSR